MKDHYDTGTLSRRLLLAGAGALATHSPSLARPYIETTREVWTLDQLGYAGEHPVKIEGAPKLVSSPYGAAVQFNGVDDALYIECHPLAGAEQFTFEALFRPDGGAHEQRWFHLQEAAPVDGATSWPGTRFLFEIRVYDQQWCLDAFVKGPGYDQVLIYPDKLHPVGTWVHVAQTYDGARYRSFVNGVLQGEAPLAFKAQGAGGSSIGCRFNRVNYFKGAVRAAAFSRRALEPAEFILLQK